MRSLFGTYRKKEDLKAIADAKPKGIHHTVRFTSSYNETWEHIWNETKKIGLPGKEKTFISEERFSYDVKLQAKPHAAEKKDFMAAKQSHSCKAVRWERILLTPVVYEQKEEELYAQPSTPEIPETNYTKAEPQFEVQKKAGLSLAESQGAEILSAAMKLLSRELVPAAVSHGQRSKAEDKKAHPLSEVSSPVSTIQNSKEAMKIKKDTFEKDKWHQERDVELECMV